MDNTVYITIILMTPVLAAVLHVRRNGSMRRLFLFAFAGVAVGVSLLNFYYFHAFKENPGLIYNAGSATRLVKTALLDICHDKRPWLLFVGSSHSARGIDADIVERTMKERGASDYNVVVFALGGMSALEQDYHLDQLLARMCHSPAAAFFEVSKRYEDVLREYLEQGVTRRQMVLTDWTRAGWGMRFETACQPVNEWRWSALYSVAQISLLRQLGIGMQKTMKDIDDLGKVRQEFFFGHQVQKKTDEQDEDTGKTDMLSSFQKDAGGDSASGLSRCGEQWVREFRSYQKNKMENIGALMGLYVPPTVWESYNEYGSAVCAALSGTCLQMEKDEIRTLFNVADWYNATHLNRNGAEIYSRWLGNALADYLGRGKVS